MPFHFLKYLQPTHYFRLLNREGKSVFPIYQKLPADIPETMSLDLGYHSEWAREYDLSWRLIKNGYLGNVETYTDFKPVGLIDNYRFVRKNFHKAWVVYVCVLRIIILYNPIKELRAFLNTRQVRKIEHLEYDFDYDIKHFESQLISENPLVSVVIPTLNRYEYLRKVLKDFESQTYKNFEVVVVDQSDDFDQEFYNEFEINVKVIRQKEKALWLARNTAIQKSNGKFIALSEDDVRIQPNWLSAHLKCIEYFNADVSAGVFYPQGKSIPKSRSYYAIASQFATGNAMLYKSLYHETGLFDRQFEKQRMGDAEFGLRVYLSKFRSVSNPEASCIDIKAEKGGLREMGSWDAFRPSSLLAPRPIPSVLYYYRRYFGNTAARLMLLKTIPISLVPYRLKKNRLALLISALFGILLSPFILIQVIRSWRLATKKLKTGPLIQTL